MSHAEQLAFLHAVVARNSALVAGGEVLEVGSYDVNGSVRGLFGEARRYVGVDLAEGPGVDLVAFGHEVDHPDGTYDVTVSAECFEHDPHWRETFANMVRLTRPGGIVTVTCASRGRPEHGTRRTLVTDSPGTQSQGLDYYRNLEEDDFAVLPLGSWFSQWRFWYMPTSFDLYFAGVRAGAAARPGGELPDDEAVRTVRKLMSVPHRAVRLPLRPVARLIRDQDRYQRLVLPYWLAMVRRFGKPDERQASGSPSC